VKNELEDKLETIERDHDKLKRKFTSIEQELELARVENMQYKVTKAYKDYNRHTICRTTRHGKRK
jgi:phage shock protein A